MKHQKYKLKIKYFSFFICIFAFCSLLFNISIVSAHTLKSDETVGAVMHITPEDDPAVGEESSINFEFKDTTNTFKPNNCECTFIILQNNKELYSQPLFQNNVDPDAVNVSVVYTFLEIGEYIVRVIGNPLQNDSFEPFTLEYNVQVNRVALTPTAIPTDEVMPVQNSINMHEWQWPIVFCIVLIILMSFGIVYRVRKKK